MQEILSEYQLNPTTWAYLSALLTVGIFFKFHRFWSVRNSDLLGLIVLSPGILFIFHGTLSGRADRVQDGYIWLFVVGAFFSSVCSSIRSWFAGRCWNRTLTPAA